MITTVFSIWLTLLEHDEKSYFLKSLTINKKHDKLKNNEIFRTNISA